MESATTSQGHSLVTEIATSCRASVAFAANGEYLVSDDREGVHVWQVRDGAELAQMAARKVRCLAVSKGGNRIAAGTVFGNILVWDFLGTGGNEVFHTEDNPRCPIWAVDFSPDATRLVAASNNGAAAVWDIAAHQQVFSLGEGWVGAAKYSPQGDRIAIGATSSVLIYDSNNGHPLLAVPLQVRPFFNTGLLWSGSDQLFVLTLDKINRVNVTSGQIVAEWLVPDANYGSTIALSQRDEVIAYATGRSVTLWDASTYAYLGLIEHSARDISAMTLSPDGRSLAIASGGGGLAIHSISGIILSTPAPHLHPTFQEPVIRANDEILDLWKHDQLADAEELLSAAILASHEPRHDILASRSLIRIRLREWDAAIDDAEQSIAVEASLLGYIAKSIALVGKGERSNGYRTCDIAFEYFHANHVSFLLLIKAIIIFVAGGHADAISRIGDLIDAVRFSSPCYTVQAYMYFLQGSSQMEGDDYEAAIDSFERARARSHDNLSLSVISLIFGWKFDGLDIRIRQRICEALLAAGRTTEAVSSFLEWLNTFNRENYTSGQEWVPNFKLRCCERLEHLGDVAMDAQRHDEAIAHYSTALSLDPDFPQGLFIKRGKARRAQGSWDDALSDVNEAIARDPSSLLGYETKHAILHGAKRYADAVDAFETMLSKMTQSSEPDIRACRSQYISPSDTRTKVRAIVQQTLRHLPRVLINTSTGHLQNRAQLASAFESSPVFSELLSSMTTRIEQSRIKREVKQYFRYVMLSHKWEDNEPSFQEVLHVAVYDLDQSPTHGKLQTFCKIVRDAGFNWAWSDTCCIDKQDHFVLQEALVAMFKWYRNSALVIVYLGDIRSPAQFGDLGGSIWNTRAWTFQEYVAGKVVHFYTNDWELYLGLDIPNHKESPRVVSEMEQATGVSAQQLMSLRPGLSNIRQKLCLASTRRTTLVEDAAYSLLGIFSVTGIPAIYGEGESALGRLLAHILSGSGDVSILAWIGQSSTVNSCLPARIAVYTQPATSHLPVQMQNAEMEDSVAMLRDSELDFDLAMQLYDRINELPTPWFVASRMKLPCIAFRLPPFSHDRTSPGRVYRAETPAFGMVKIKTRRDLTRLKILYLVHPWLDALLDREDMQGDIAVSPSFGGSDSDSDDDEDSLPPSNPEPELSSPTRVDAIQIDRETRALQLLSRLRQPFGALLFTLASTSRREVEYTRIVSDSLITVQIQGDVPLSELLENVRTLDVL